MAYVITAPCIGECDTACVEVCPMDCIHGPHDPQGMGAEVKDLGSLEGLQLYIEPEQCIDCGACEPECPVEAIFYEDDLPDKWAHFKQINEDFFSKS